MCIKKIAGALRAISGSPHPKNFTSAIIAAAGLSERFGGTTTKQMTDLCGDPVLLHTLRAYQNTECIHEIIIVAKRNEIPFWARPVPFAENLFGSHSFPFALRPRIRVLALCRAYHKIYESRQAERQCLTLVAYPTNTVHKLLL